ncbi:MAG: ATP-binding protein [Lachnospiraceae bacterium]
MKLLSCKIEGFGKISNKTFDFTDGINVFCEDNGWGKSTLAAFILTMFYGFDGESKRDDYSNERKRYKPWQKGNYGGSLTFKAGDKTYTITRIFGNKSADDTMQIRDVATNLPVTLTSAQPGEEFFGIDRNSFCRTAFITQNDCNTQTTDSINAKLGNLADNTDDINNYEKVAERLGALLTSMSPRRSTGSLSKAKSEILNLETEIRQGAGIDSAITSIKDKIQYNQDRIKCLESERSELAAKRTEVTMYSKIKNLREQADVLRNETFRRNEKLTEAEKAFPLHKPTKQQIQETIDICRNYLSAQEKSKMVELNGPEEAVLENYTRHFYASVPSEEDIALNIDRAKKVKKLSEQLTALKPDKEEEKQLQDYYTLFGNGIPEEDDFKCVRAALYEKEERKKSLDIKKDRKNMIENQPVEKHKDNSFVIMLAGIILTIAGIAGFFINHILGIGGIVLGVVTLAAGIVTKHKAAQIVHEEQMDKEEKIGILVQGITEDEQCISNAEVTIKNFFGGYGIETNGFDENIRLYELEKEAKNYKRMLLKSNDECIFDYEKQIRLLKGDILSFLNSYEEPVQNGEDYESSIFILDKKAREYERLKNKDDEHSKFHEMARINKSRLDEFFTYTGIIPDENDLLAQLIEIGKKLENYEGLNGEYKDAVIRYNQFMKENENNFHREITIPDNEISPEEIDKRLNEIDEETNSIKDMIRDYLRQEEEMAEKRDALTETENSLREKKALYDESKKKFDLLTQTLDLLNKAKTSFTTRYMEPIMKGYKKYYSMISGTEAEHFLIDANTKLTVEEQGAQRETKFLSAGNRDLVGICMRMALIEAMYEGEKPFVVFDDPFVNQDEGRTEKGKGFLRNIAKEYQVIYFTCNSDRV